MADKILWGIIGTGRIAGVFAKGAAKCATGKVIAAGSRSQAKADAFGKEFGIERCYGTYEALLADRDVQAVYISTPHPQHPEWAIKAARAGKHILCEKPLAINHPQAMAVVEAARANDVLLMEAFMYRCHPQTAQVVELVKEGAIGTVRMIQASFGFHAGFNAESRLFKNDLAGGGILDVGCYAVSMARLIAGTALGRPFADPLEVKGCGYLGTTGVDEWTAAVLKFENGIIAQVATGVSLTLENGVRIFGTDGNIFVPTPWIPAREGGTVEIVVTVKGESRTIPIETDQWLYGLEADTLARSLPAREAASPAMSPQDTLGNMLTLDQWREAIGLEYAMEKPAALTIPVHGGPLKAPSKSTMTYGNLPGLDKKISRLIIGADYQRRHTHAAVMMDDFFERGGNAVDTAYIYGGGLSEKIVGQWVKNRGIRKEIVILDKGAHTPYCTPEHLQKQFAESLDRLQTDYVDIYMMHRDNPDIPAGEFVDAINELVAKGQIRVYGGSNWAPERIDTANAYAAKHQKDPFTAVSNNFSLARMVDAVWGGCIASSEPAVKAWHTKTQMPLMPWSSQARGFFVPGRAHPDKKEDAELVRCWYSDDNFKRLERANELAKKKGVLPINIALAYVLCQPFPTFALIGPRIIEETRTSWPALEIELTPEEVKWLNLEV